MVNETDFADWKGKLAGKIVILGEDEAASRILTIKDFATGEQMKVPWAELKAHLLPH